MLCTGVHSPEARQAIRAAEGEIVVRFELPDGASVDHAFQLGQTVQACQAWLQTEHGVPMAQSKLYLDDALMFPPLSLSDLPGVAGQDRVRVRVDAPGGGGGGDDDVQETKGNHK